MEFIGYVRNMKEALAAIRFLGRLSYLPINKYFGLNPKENPASGRVGLQILFNKKLHDAEFRANCVAIGMGSSGLTGALDAFLCLYRCRDPRSHRRK